MFFYEIYSVITSTVCEYKLKTFVCVLRICLDTPLQLYDYIFSKKNNPLLIFKFCYLSYKIFNFLKSLLKSYSIFEWNSLVAVTSGCVERKKEKNAPCKYSYNRIYKPYEI